jgi:glycosyltransferase involved in cell wall biosynthesis
MGKDKKISFLMPAHNEEKIIEKALKSLVSFYKDYKNIEVLIGLDGCTDKTYDIAKKYSRKYTFFKIFILNERKGKQAVLNKLESHIKGEIVIIHDADWIYVYKDEEKIKEFVKLFDDKNVGGVAAGFAADFFPMELDKIKSPGFLASGWGNHFLVEYLKKSQTIRKKGKLIVDRKKMIFPFFLDVYRKSALAETKPSEKLRAGDHVERTIRLLKAGYNIIVPEDEDLPRSEVTYKKLSVRDFVKQRIRGIISKGKIKKEYKTKTNIWNFHLPFFWYTIKSLKEIRRLRDLVAIFLYWGGITYAMAAAKIITAKEVSVKEVWNMRMNR